MTITYYENVGLSNKYEHCKLPYTDFKNSIF